MEADLLKFIHLLSSALFLGAGFCAWILMLMAYRSQIPERQILAVKFASLMDLWLVTPCAVILYFAGRLLAAKMDLVMSDTPWIHGSIIVFGATGFVWLLLLIPIQMILEKRLSQQANFMERLGSNRRLYWTWFVVGGIAKISLLRIFYIMVMKN